MTDPSTEPTGQSPWASRPVIASIVVVAAILVLGLVLVLSNAFGGGDDQQPDAGGPPPASSTADSTGSSSTSPEGSEPSVCGLPGEEDSGTVATAPVAVWSLVGTTAAPAVEGSGPGEVEPDGYRSCYAHTPTGALIAAANYAAIGSEASLREKYYERAIVPGLGQNALLDKPITGSNGGGVRVQIAGFRVLRYTGDQADLDLAIRTSRGAIAGAVLNLQWSDGDWKLRLADDGTELSPVVQLPDLAGYVPWSGA